MIIQPADPRHFLYRDALDPDAALRLTAQTLKDCDDGELYLQYLTSESFGFDDGRLKTADYNTQAGFGLRGVSGETTAFAHAFGYDPDRRGCRAGDDHMGVLGLYDGFWPRRLRRLEALCFELR